MAGDGHPEQPNNDPNGEPLVHRRNALARLSGLDHDPGMGFRRSLSSLVNLAVVSRLPVFLGPLPRLVFLGACFGTLVGSPRAIATRASPPSTGRPAVYGREQVLLHTDVVERLVDDQLARLQKLKQRLDGYWGKKLEGKLVCYWVADLTAWPVAEIPQAAREQIEQRSAVTLTNRETLDDRVVSTKSVVYSSWETSNLLHEVVHAFCWQTFGRCGPDWYAEGMAELFGSEDEQLPGVHYFAWAIDYLRKDTAPPTPTEIVSGRMSDRALWQTYAHRWALCYLLSHHPRYSDRFQTFGSRLLRGDDADFLRDFADVRQSLADDYRQFLRDVQTAYEFQRQAGNE